jgi:hypothetical protein
VFLFLETEYHRDGPTSSTTQSSADKKNAKDGLEHYELPSSPPAQETGITSFVGRGSPAKHQFKLIQRPDRPWKAFWSATSSLPSTCPPFPIIFWAGLNVAGPANLLLFWNLTESAVLSSHPYNWSPGAVGYSNFCLCYWRYAQTRYCRPVFRLGCETERRSAIIVFVRLRCAFQRLSRTSLQP